MLQGRAEGRGKRKCLIFGGLQGGERKMCCQFGGFKDGGVEK